MRGTATLINSTIHDNFEGLRIGGKVERYDHSGTGRAGLLSSLESGSPVWLYDSIGTATLINTHVYGNEVFDGSQSYLTRFNIHNQGILSITSGHIGAGMDLRAGSTTTYILPAPPGHWLPATKCEVQREDPGCRVGIPGKDCRAAAVSCLTNTLDNVNPCNASTGSCMPVTANQPCDWRTSPELLGKTVYVLPAWNAQPGLSLCLCTRHTWRRWL